MSKKTIEEVAKNIWEYAEIRFKEYNKYIFILIIIFLRYSFSC